MTHGERVKARILSEGVDLLADGMSCVTAREIGRQIGMSHTAVLYHFGDAAALRDAVAEQAVAIGARDACRHLIAMRHAAVQRMSDAERLAVIGA